MSLAEKILPEHVRTDRDPPELYVQPRRKGAGVGAAWVPLLPPAVDALRELFRLEAHGGSWHRGVLRLAWNRAVKATQRTLRSKGRREDADRLTGMRPYDLRHSLLTALARASGDIYAMAEAARHSDLRTTRRFMRGAASDRMRAGMAALAKILPQGPRDGATNDEKSAAGTGSDASTVDIGGPGSTATLLDKADGPLMP